MLMKVTTIEIPIETPMFIWSLLIKAIPILIPKDIPISINVNNHMKNLRVLFLVSGNPTQFHFISSGYGAFRTLTPYIGKSVFLKMFQKFDKAGGLFRLWISRIAYDDLSVTKITFSSARPTFCLSCSEEFI